MSFFDIKFSIYDIVENLLAKANSQVGILKNYNCKKLTVQYDNLLLEEVQESIKFNKNECKFYFLKENNER